MKLAVLFSGGKDSTYALYLAQQKHDVVCLVTLNSQNEDSYMFHTPNINLAKLQAEALGIPLIEYTTKGEKEKEIEDMQAALQKAKDEYKVEGVVSGAVHSIYQTTRVQQVCAKLNLTSFNPLWLMDQEELLHDLIKHNFDIRISAIAAYPFDETYLGKSIKDIQQKLLRDAKQYKINPAGEGGEYETLVVNGPNFKRAVTIKSSKKLYDNHVGKWLVTEAEVER